MRSITIGPQQKPAIAFATRAADLILIFSLPERPAALRGLPTTVF
jgi:hypothetical protein